MEKKMFDFIENYGGAFFVGSLVSQKVIYINKKAKIMFGVDLETCDFAKIFSSNSQRIEDIMSFMLSSDQATTIYNYPAIKADGTQIIVDLQLGYFDDDKTEVFLDLVPQNDTRLQMAIHQVDNASRAEAILNLDDRLSIIHCNQTFYDFFPTNQSNLKNDLINIFLREDRQNLVTEILSNLEISNSYSTNLKVKVAGGDELWYSIEFQRRTLDNSGFDKVMAFMVNIEKQVELENECSLLHQYMSILQETTTDILYRVDVKSLNLHYYKDIFDEHAGERIIPDYINTFMNSNIIHPDDKKQYLENLAEFNAGGEPQTPIRYSLSGEPYHWYRITGKNIYDIDGEVVEVIGALVNVDSEFAFYEEISTLTKYFDCLQSISGVSFFIINIKEKTLNQTGKVAEEIAINEPITNFPDSVLDRVYPDDLKKYVKYTALSMEGEHVNFEVRVMTIYGDYQWYNIISNPIFDKNGVPVEVVGKMNNINTVKTMQIAFSSVSNYYEAMKELSSDAIFHVDINTKTYTHNYMNDTGTTLPMTINDFVNTFIESGYIYPDDITEYRKYTERLFAGHNIDYKVRALISDDTYEWVKIKSKYLYNDDGEMVEIFGTIENIQAQVDLEHKANYDKLTNVLSRGTFEELVSDDLKHITKGEISALIFIDIDDFKFINDNYGHQFGDFILEKFTERLRNCVKKSDFIGRFGGDEFVVFIKDISNPQVALERSNYILERMVRPFTHSDIKHNLGLSIGISVAPLHGTELTTLYDKADKAVYKSKALGKNRASLYS